MELSGLIQLIFLPLILFAYGLYSYSQRLVKEVTFGGPKDDFTAFQKMYFLPYFMALFSDWLQGPYVYKLYSYYGFPQEDIALLYIVGFAASVLFGTATGPIADK